MRVNDRVCFQMDCGHELVRGPAACHWGMKYRSVVGYGRLSAVTEPAERQLGLQALMRQYGGQALTAFDPAVLGKTMVLRLRVDSLTGKQKA
jgi:nitroimidazol reductase NimA-like FMN-containing flavoprotein (pyridoxamine 5'-phosphate oxidase superfamily)